MPVLKAAKRLREMAPGKVLRLSTDDPAAIVDVPHFCQEQGHNLLEKSEIGAVQIYLIKRGPQGE